MNEIFNDKNLFPVKLPFQKINYWKIAVSCFNDKAVRVIFL